VRIWRKGNPHAVSGNVNWCSHCGNQWRFLKKLKIEISYDLLTSLLDIYPKKTKTLNQKDKCTPMFTAALFTVAKKQKQPKRPSMDE